MSTDPTSDTILDYHRALTTMWVLYHTLTKGQLSRYKFKYESHRNVIEVIKKYHKFLQPLVIRLMRVGTVVTNCVIDEMEANHQTVAWDGTTIDALRTAQDVIPRFMIMFGIPPITDEETYERESELSLADDVHLTRLFHKVFPNLPYGFDETKPWPTTCGRYVDPSTIPMLSIYS